MKIKKIEEDKSYIWRIIIGILISFLISNCAFSEGIIKLNYPKAVVDIKTKSKTTIAFERTTDSPIAYQDGLLREGIRKNGYGMETAHMFTDPKGPELLKKVVTMELQNAGFDIVQEKNNRNPEIEIEVNKVFMEPEVGFFAGDVVTVVDAVIIVKINQKEFRRRFKGIGSVRTIAWIDKFYEESLSKSLEDFSRKAVPEIIKLIESEKIGIKR